MQDALREGFALLAANRLEEASECCRRLLGAKPDLVEGHFLVGLIALELKQTWAAVSAFGSVTKLGGRTQLSANAFVFPLRSVSGAFIKGTLRKRSAAS